MKEIFLEGCPFCDSEVEYKDDKKERKRTVLCKKTGDILQTIDWKDDKIDYDQLYYDKEIRISGNNLPYPVECNVEINGADCKVGHFGFNFWFRTNAGIKGKEYSSRKRLESVVERMLKRKGFEVLGWRDRIIA